ncbi:MAG: hypothetical protein ACLSBG_02545 [Sellimonas intestinalis]
MPHDTEDMIQLLLNTNKEQEQTIVDLRATIKELREHYCEPERDDR